MPERLEREQLILLVEKLNQGAGTEEQADEWLDAVDRSVPTPTSYVSDLILRHDDADALTSAEIVDKALSYKPVCL